MPDPDLTDEEAALQAIATLTPLSTTQQLACTEIKRVIDNDAADPFVDIHALFALYDTLYFRALLSSRVEVSWSSRMTLCAGMCEISTDEQGKFGRIRLKMSEPLLKFRPRIDTINTLLHEAIHAYFFVTTSWKHCRGEDGTGHGLGFIRLSDAINKHGEYQITVFHTFHDEVDSYRRHIWQCDGPCQHTPPLFGIVKRTMNRPPGKYDPWWKQHEQECGGTYTKIAEPELTKVQVANLSAKQRAGRQKNKIDGWIVKAKKEEVKDISKTLEDRPRLKRRADSLEPEPEASAESSNKQVIVTCPICDTAVTENEINQHLDAEHPV